jgi:hypothetical protein
MNGRLISGNAYCPPIKNMFSCFLLSVKAIACRAIILPSVLYWCETWSLILTEGHRLRVFENRVLRTIFGPKRDEVIGGLRKLHNEELLLPGEQQ